MADVFISYAREDHEHARKVASALSEHGWSVWWDRKIIAGQAFDQVIERELETARSVVVLWSKASVSSEWVKNEAAVAVERGVLVPALIESVKVPLEFRRKQTSNLILWDGDPLHLGFQELCEGVSNATGIAAQHHPIPEPRARLRWNRYLAYGAIASSLAAVLAIVAYSTRPLPDSPAPITPPPLVGVKAPSLRLNISGVWLGNTGRYTVTHEGSRVVWDGIGSYGNKVWHHSGKGTVDGYTIRGAIEELPDSNFPGYTGGSRVEGTIAIDGQTISWTGMNPQERIWQRGNP